MKKYLLTFLLCTLCAACAAQTYFIALPHNNATKSYALWYTYENTTIPLLAGFEQSKNEAQLGLVFLQGKRFAQCTYKDNTLRCTLDSALQSRSMQKIADNCALIIAHILKNENPLPQGWEYTNKANNLHNFINKNTNSKLRIEEN